MPDNFKKDTSIEDEIEKSLQKMVEEETTVAKALVGKNDLPSNMKTADINDGKTRVIPQIIQQKMVSRKMLWKMIIFLLMMKRMRLRNL